MAVRSPVARRSPFLPEIPAEENARRYPGYEPLTEIVAIMDAEHRGKGLDPLPNLAALVPVRHDQAEDAARILAKDPTAKVKKPPSKDQIAALRREVSEKVARWQTLGAVPKVDHDAWLAAFFAATDEGGPQAAWLVHVEMRRAATEYENAARERQELAEWLGHSAVLGYRKRLKPGDSLHGVRVPEYPALLAQAMHRVPPESAKGGR